MQINGRTQTIAPNASANVKGGTQISKDGNGNYTIDLNNKGNKVDISQNKDGSWTVVIDKKTKLKLSDDEMKNLTLNTNGGDDKVTIKRGDLQQPINVNLGDGNDSLKLGFDPKTRTFVDKNKVNFEPGKRISDHDTFEYVTKGTVTAGEGQPMPSSAFRQVKEEH